MTPWSLEQDSDWRGVIRHNTPPRFRAYWTSGVAEEATPLEPFLIDRGSGHDDRLYLYAVHWIDAPPEAGDLEKLMKQASRVIEFWIENRL